ncbi:hypothetical protein ACFYNY_10280 [Streptomyces sp. NPDC006530]|uniref:hypothetical protein n=1 Tax=Streptomyces sp. NPDC006530 TaxID=3364750 RepID=UPI0036AA02C2
MNQPSLKAVAISLDSLKSFTSSALEEYEACTPEDPPGCFAVLVGSVEGDVAIVADLEFATNARAVEQVALEEFSTTVAPCFGAAYKNPRRGFWCSSRDLLRIHRRADELDLEILGSIHLHPDWHRIGPLAERGLCISEIPTPMDEYMFRNTGYAVNMICYMESTGGTVSTAIAAWTPPSDTNSPCNHLPVRFLVS